MKKSERDNLIKKKRYLAIQIITTDPHYKKHSISKYLIENCYDDIFLYHINPKTLIKNIIYESTISKNINNNDNYVVLIVIVKNKEEAIKISSLLPESEVLYYFLYQFDQSNMETESSLSEPTFICIDKKQFHHYALSIESLIASFTLKNFVGTDLADFITVFLETKTVLWWILEKKELNEIKINEIVRKTQRYLSDDYSSFGLIVPLNNEFKLEELSSYHDLVEEAFNDTKSHIITCPQSPTLNGKVFIFFGA